MINGGEDPTSGLISLTCVWFHLLRKTILQGGPVAQKLLYKGHVRGSWELSFLNGEERKELKNSGRAGRSSSPI